MKAAPVMVINQVAYREQKPNAAVANCPAGECLQCAFFADAVGCELACDGKAAAAFGGDCVQRNVVYAFANARRAA